MSFVRSLKVKILARLGVAPGQATPFAITGDPPLMLEKGDRERDMKATEL
jgi:hypothetical protein